MFSQRIVKVIVSTRQISFLKATLILLSKGPQIYLKIDYVVAKLLKGSLNNKNSFLNMTWRSLNAKCGDSIIFCIKVLLTDCRQQKQKAVMNLNEAKYKSFINFHKPYSLYWLDLLIFKHKMFFL